MAPIRPDLASWAGSELPCTSLPCPDGCRVPGRPLESTTPCASPSEQRSTLPSEVEWASCAAWQARSHRLNGLGLPARQQVRHPHQVVSGSYEVPSQPSTLHTPIEAVHPAAGLAEAKSGDGPDGRERTRRGGGDGLRSSGSDGGLGDGSPPGGLGADHRPVLLAAQLRLAYPQPEARGRDRGVGGCLGLLRGRSQLPGDRQLPSSGGCRSAPSPTHARLPGVLPAPGLHLRASRRKSTSPSIPPCATAPAGPSFP